MFTSPLNDSLINNKRKNTKDKILREEQIILIKSKTNRKNFNSMSKFHKSKKNKNFEKQHTSRFLNNNLLLYERAKKEYLNIIKREKSADHLKNKSLSLRKRIKYYFNEIGYYDSNNNQNTNKNQKKNNNKNYNTLIQIKKGKDDFLINKKRKSYFSPERIDQQKKINFYKRLLNLRTISGAKMNNNEFFYYNFKENLNINNNFLSNLDNNNYASIIKRTFNAKNKNGNKNKKMINNNKEKKGNKYLNNKNNNDYYIYFSQNNINNIGLISQKKNKNNNNPLCKSSNIDIIQSKFKENQNIKSKNSLGDKSISLERITVNKNEENINNYMNSTNKININSNFNDNISKTANNFYKINVKKLDSISNCNTNNSININFNKIAIEENKISKKNEICLTDDNDFINKNKNFVKELRNENKYKSIVNHNEIKIQNEDMSIINDAEYSFNKEGNINNIRVCKNPDIQAKKNKKDKKITNKQKLKKRSGTQDPFSDNNSAHLIKRERSKNKTPNKESISSLRHFKKYLLQNNNIKSNICSCSISNFAINYLYNILPGNNGKLVEKVLKTRENWDSIEPSQSHLANLIWTPLSCQINFAQHSIAEITQYVNHFEFHSELTNKANTFINLFRYCEFNDIDLFSFYPLTIILSSNQDYLQTQIEGLKRCYQDLPNLIYYSSDKDKNNNLNNNFISKYYINYFFVNLSKKIGSLQKMKIPKTHYIGKNLWVLKRTNLNRGRQMKVLSNIDEIIKEINLMFEEKKPNNLIIQKYIEEPLLYNGRKFDIRIWVLFTYIGKDYKYEAFVFKEGHLKACSDIFNIDSDNLFIHLTNYSVQKHNKNFSKVEIGNEISFQLFQQELNRQNSGKNFKKDIFPEMIKIIGLTLKAVKNKINIMNRKNCFEIFGYDFILDVNFKPFLLEINTNPGLEESSPLIKMLVPRMIDDALRLTIDKSFDNSDGNEKNKSISKFHVDGYSDEENMWQKIKNKKKQ